MSPAQAAFIARQLDYLRRKLMDRFYDDTAAARRLLATCGAPFESGLRISERRAARTRRPR